jgi:hypothetical protein
MMFGLMLIVPVLVQAPAPVAQADEGGTLNGGASPMWQTNNSVWALAVSNNVLYAGGDFTSVRPPGDPSGTGEVTRTRIAAFNANTGALITSFNHSVNGGVRALAVSADGSTLYIGGTFSQVDGQSRTNLAAINLTTNALSTTWKPTATGPVLAMTVFGGNVYFGGGFTKVNNVAHTRLGAVNGTTGAVLPWSPSADRVIAAIAIPPEGGRVIVGGFFDNLDGVAQHGIGAVDIAAGTTSLPWAFDPVDETSEVKTIITDDQGHAFIGAEGTGGGVFDGTFAVNYADGSRVWFDPCLGATQSLVLLNGWLFDGSHMHDCQGQVQGGPFTIPNTWWHLVVESPTDGHIGHWFPNTSGNPLGPKAMTTDGSQLFVGGDFHTVNSVAQQGLTRFGPGDTTTPKNPPKPAASSKYCAGTVNVSFQSSKGGLAQAADPDDGLLTYNLYRDSGTTPIDTTQADLYPWETQSFAFQDTGLAPGSSHTYKVTASDPHGNTTPKVSSAAVTVASTTDAYPCDVVSNGPTLYWRLDESSGTTAADSSGNNNTGIYESGTTQGQPGAPIGDGDTATAFNGSGGLVTSNTQFVDPENFTLDFWLKTTTTSGGKIIGFGNNQTGDSGNYDRHVYMTNSGQLIFGVWDGFPAIVESPSSYNDGTWHHVVASIDSTHGEHLIIDGSLVASHGVDGSGNYGFSQAYSGYWRVGGDNLNGWPQQPSSENFQGSVDEVAVYPFAVQPGNAEAACTTMSSPFSADTGAITPNSATTAGNSIAATVAHAIPAGQDAWVVVGSNMNPSVTSVTDSQGNTWTVDQQRATTGGAKSMTAVAHARITTALSPGDTITAHLSLSPPTRYISGMAAQGVQAGGVDVSASAEGTSTGPDSGATATTSQASELAVGSATIGLSTDALSPGSDGHGHNATNIDHRVVGTSNQRAFGAEYVVLNATEAAHATFSSSASGQWGAAVATYKVMPPTQTTSYTCLVKADGAAPYWRLGEASGTTAQDSSTNGLNGTYGSGVTLGQPGAISDGDTAASFDGTGNGLVYENQQVNDPESFSIEAWFKTTTTSGGKIVGFGNQQSGDSSAYDRHIYMTNSGQLIFGVWDGFPAIVESPASYNDGTYHQVVATIDPSDGEALYVDGALVASHAVDGSGNYGTAQPFSGYWRVGGDNIGGWPDQPSSNYFQGTIDDVSIDAIPLSAAQVQAHYQAAQ